MAVKIGLVGTGTVGGGCIDIIQKHKDDFLRHFGVDIELARVCSLSPAEAEAHGVGHLFTDNFNNIINDPEIDIVVELIGGTTIARTVVLNALAAGKNVVTANKALMATHGKEVMEAAEAAGKELAFEASVGGGIPIIRPLGSCLAANEISEIYGILNGTTNYILTKMIKEGLSFDTALKQAQEKGYAEADPTADVEGFDACRKICILASLSFGRHVYPAQVPTQGITGVTAQDVALAEAAGMKIKLLGRAILQEDGKVVAYVAPHLIPADQQMAGVEDVFNGIVVRGDAIGDVMFYGRGAGKLPTASAVVADIIDAVKHHDRRQNLDWAPGGDDVVGSFEDLPLRWYLRTPEQDAKIAATFGDGKTVTAGEEKAVFTGLLTKRELDQKLTDFKALTCLPVLA